MREIFLVSGDSTESSLVFRSSAEDGAEEFFIAVTDELRTIVAGRRPEAAGATAITSATGLPAPVVLSSVDGGENPDATDADDTPAADSPGTPVMSPAPTPVRVPREEREIDPRISAPLTMPPREIQARIRSGATVVELAEENGVTEARIEPYAHPVLLERARIAELAKQSHPVRDSGPAKLTLWEILATAFAARGHDLTTATWDAYRDVSNQWIVRVDWKAGLSDNHAEWSLNLHNTSSPTTEPRTPVAADLIDPDFIQPIRTLTSIGGGQQYSDDLEDDTDGSLDGSEDSVSADTTDARRPHRNADDRPAAEHGEDREDGAEDGSAPADGAEDAPRNRRRKAVTPHWEDVLLGVRANTRRPKK